MKISKSLVVLGLFFSTAGFSQDYAFKVLANKGTNEVKSGDSWQALKTGTSLKAGDQLRISENAYVGLVHSSGKPIELKKADTYDVSALASKIGAGASVLNKYTDFILSSNSAEAKKNRLSATGAVHRGLEDIKVFLPENQFSEIFNTVAIVNWEASKSGGPYIVTLKNMFDDELAKIETPETTVKIDLTEPKFANETAVLVEVKSKADTKSKSESHVIKKLSAKRYETIKQSYTEISTELQEETALNKLILAAFFEENKLFIDAITAYEQAIKLDPDTPSYKEAYEEFLYRNKLKQPK